MVRRNGLPVLADLLQFGFFQLLAQLIHRSLKSLDFPLALFHRFTGAGAMISPFAFAVIAAATAEQAQMTATRWSAQTDGHRMVRRLGSALGIGRTVRQCPAGIDAHPTLVATRAGVAVMVMVTGAARSGGVTTDRVNIQRLFPLVLEDKENMSRV